MRFTTFCLALLLPAVASASSFRISRVEAPRPPHCLAAEQWQGPDLHSPLNLFDGTDGAVWSLCSQAAAETDYTITFYLAEPISLDMVRLVQGKSPRAVRRVDIAFFDDQLSQTHPIYFRELNFVGQRPAEVTLQGKLKWNPALLDDLAFGELRRAKGLDAEHLPAPLTITRFSLTFRAIQGGAGVPALSELVFFREGTALILENLAEARAARVRQVEEGLRLVTTGLYWVGDARTLHFRPDGMVEEIAALAWSKAELTGGRVLGKYQVQGGRLLYARPTSNTFEPVRYTVDGAPEAVELKHGALGGTYRVVSGPPVNGAPAPLGPSLESAPTKADASPELPTIPIF